LRDPQSLEQTIQSIHRFSKVIRPTESTVCQGSNKRQDGLTTVRWEITGLYHLFRTQRSSSCRWSHSSRRNCILQAFTKKATSGQLCSREDADQPWSFFRRTSLKKR
jgi:hypothetical protein